MSCTTQNIYLTQICCKLQSFDSWSNKLYSGKINIIQDQVSNLLTVANKIEPIKIYANEKAIITIPFDLILHFSGDTLEYFATTLNCSQNKKLDISIEPKEDLNYLSLMTNVTQDWFCAIQASNSYNHTTEIIFEVISLNWLISWIKLTCNLLTVANVKKNYIKYMQKLVKKQ